MRHRIHARCIAVMVTVVMVIMSLVGCSNRAAQAPIPGAVNSLDSWAFRIVADSDAAIHQAKIWEQCTALSPATTVSIDGKTETCTPGATPFPMAYKDDLNRAIDALNTAKAVGAAYHDLAGASGDSQGLTTAINNLSTAISTLLSHIGGK